MYQEPKRFFVREFLLILIAFGGIVVTAILSGIGGVAIIVAALLDIIIFITMVVMFIISIVHFIKFLADKENKQTPIMYLVNMVFSFLVLGAFLMFFVFLAIAGFALIAPFTT